MGSSRPVKHNLENRTRQKQRQYLLLLFLLTQKEIEFEVIRQCEGALLYSVTLRLWPQSHLLNAAPAACLKAVSSEFIQEGSS